LGSLPAVCRLGSSLVCLPWDAWLRGQAGDGGPRAVEESRRGERVLCPRSPAWPWWRHWNLSSPLGFVTTQTGDGCAFSPTCSDFFLPSVLGSLWSLNGMLWAGRKPWEPGTKFIKS